MREGYVLQNLVCTFVSPFSGNSFFYCPNFLVVLLKGKLFDFPSSVVTKRKHETCKAPHFPTME